LAHYFNGLKETQCLHQASNGFTSTEELVKFMEGFPSSEKITHVGDSDSISSFFPTTNFPTVVVRRDITEVIRSMRCNTTSRVDSETIGLYEELDSILNHTEGLHVNYHDINLKIQDIHEYLVDVPFDKKYADKMKRRVITKNTPELLCENTFKQVVVPAIRDLYRTN